jgi:hypothetical protein
MQENRSTRWEDKSPWQSSVGCYAFCKRPRPLVGDRAYLYRADGLLSTQLPPRGVLRRFGELIGVKAPQSYFCVGTVVDTSEFDETGLCGVLET